VVAAADARMQGNLVRLWEVATGQELHAFAGMDYPVRSLRFAPDGRILAAGGADSTIVLWDVAGSATNYVQRAALDVEACWADLGAEDAVRAWKAGWALSATPQRCVELMRKQLRPAAVVSAPRLAALVTDLDSNDYWTRERASMELAKMREIAVPTLQQALAGDPSLEVRRRTEDLLARLERVPAPEQLRLLRSVAILERIATPEARNVLRALAGGAPEALLSRETRASLQRLNRRDAVVP
jgi:hypothetical protein